MGLTSRLQSWYDTQSGQQYQAVQVNQAERNALRESIGEGKLLRVSPNPDNQGMKGSEEFFQNIHDPIESWGGLGNRSRVEAFEIWFEDGVVNLNYYLPSRDDRQREQEYRSLIDAEYKNSRISEVNGLFPAIDRGEYIAGADFTLKRMRHYPIRSVDGVMEFVFDPYRALISSITDTPDNRVVLQFVYKPALDSWSEGGPFGKINPWRKSVADIAEEVRKGRLEDGVVDSEIQDPSREEKSIAEVIANQRDKHAYHVNVRLLTMSPDKSVAEENARTIASKLKTQYSEVQRQELTPRPMKSNEVLDHAQQMCRREFNDQRITLTIAELAGLAHIPNESIQSDSLQWHQGNNLGRVPPEASRYTGGSATTGGSSMRFGAQGETSDTEPASPEGEENSVEANGDATEEAGRGSSPTPSNDSVDREDEAATPARESGEKDSEAERNDRNRQKESHRENERAPRETNNVSEENHPPREQTTGTEPRTGSDEPVGDEGGSIVRTIIGGLIGMSSDGAGVQEEGVRQGYGNESPVPEKEKRHSVGRSEQQKREMGRDQPPRDGRGQPEQHTRETSRQNEGGQQNTRRKPEQGPVQSHDQTENTSSKENEQNKRESPGETNPNQTESIPEESGEKTTAGGGESGNDTTTTSPPSEDMGESKPPEAEEVTGTSPPTRDADLSIDEDSKEETRDESSLGEPEELNSPPQDEDEDEDEGTEKLPDPEEDDDIDDVEITHDHPSPDELE